MTVTAADQAYAEAEVLIRFYPGIHQVTLREKGERVLEFVMRNNKIKILDQIEELPDLSSAHGPAFLKVRFKNKILYSLSDGENYLVVNKGNHDFFYRAEVSGFDINLYIDHLHDPDQKAAQELMAKLFRAYQRHDITMIQDLIHPLSKSKHRLNERDFVRRIENMLKLKPRPVEFVVRDIRHQLKQKDDLSYLYGNWFQLPSKPRKVGYLLRGKGQPTTLELLAKYEGRWYLILP